jgi:hypothetical protein
LLETSERGFEYAIGAWALFSIQLQERDATFVTVGGDGKRCLVGRVSHLRHDASEAESDVG